MGMGVVVGRRGIVSEMNVVPLIDILLVMLVIFMILPHRQRGLDAALPQQSNGNGRNNHRSSCVGRFGSHQSVGSTARSVGCSTPASFRSTLGSGCVSPGRSLAGISSGCPSSRPHAFGGCYTHRPAEF